ncbi:polysaccharide deacetylase family protein [Chryseosolibacter indicus]|uniref:Polysaccharide deacetylase family protein n=1 Tax=Chryseosolibacter indicus TaxID=2782351 RepID=A0ABS5VRG1_9BACT|nr:polysaccharide deacetylase family protein [Chryseosolibacter indicus]MBT1703354.1 polysaccharide deacetylase family protein [Chryseosolibacter indicus]
MKHILLFILLLPFCLHAQQIALTFDDAPTPDGLLYQGEVRTARIIDHLRKHNVKEVAFFVITSNINASGQERLRKYTDEGFLLANHTHTHQPIKSLGTPKYIEDIIKADSILRPVKGFAPWFRYPFLDEGRSRPARDSIRDALKKLELQNGYVTIDNYDWFLNALLQEAIQKKQRIDTVKLREVYIDHIWQSIVFYDNIAKKQLTRSPKHVLLLHENDLSALFLGDLITHLKKKRWKIISPTDAYKDPLASHVPDVLFNGQGRVGAIAYEKKVPAKDLVQESEDEDYLRKLVEEKGVFKQP